MAYSILWSLIEYIVSCVCENLNHNLSNECSFSSPLYLKHELNAFWIDDKIRRRVNSGKKKNNLTGKSNRWKIELIESGAKEKTKTPTKKCEEKLLCFMFIERKNEFVAPHTQYHA